MSWLKPLLSWTLIAWLATVGASAAKIQQMADTDGGIDLTMTRPGKTPIRVILRQIKAEGALPYKAVGTFPHLHPWVWGGDETELPRLLVSSIEIYEGDELITLPLSAYGDLGDVHWAYLEPTAKGFTLELSGGDAAGGYSAVFRFDGDHRLRRMVDSGEFPEKVWEKTSYRWWGAHEKN
jgi:hypothetical protein